MRFNYKIVKFNTNESHNALDYYGTKGWKVIDIKWRDRDEHFFDGIAIMEKQTNGENKLR